MELYVIELKPRSNILNFAYVEIDEHTNFQNIVGKEFSNLPGIVVSDKPLAATIEIKAQRIGHCINCSSRIVEICNATNLNSKHAFIIRPGMMPRLAKPPCQNV